LRQPGPEQARLGHAAPGPHAKTIHSEPAARKATQQAGPPIGAKMVQFGTRTQPGEDVPGNASAHTISARPARINGRAGHTQKRRPGVHAIVSPLRHPHQELGLVGWNHGKVGLPSKAATVPGGSTAGSRAPPIWQPTPRWHPSCQESGIMRLGFRPRSCGARSERRTPAGWPAEPRRDKSPGDSRGRWRHRGPRRGSMRPFGSARASNGRSTCDQLDDFSARSPSR